MTAPGLDSPSPALSCLVQAQVRRLDFRDLYVIPWMRVAICAARIKAGER
jgi:hypothetical protein